MRSVSAVSLFFFGHKGMASICPQEPSAPRYSGLPAKRASGSVNGLLTTLWQMVSSGSFARFNLYPSTFILYSRAC